MLFNTRVRSLCGSQSTVCGQHPDPGVSINPCRWPLSCGRGMSGDEVLAWGESCIIVFVRRPRYQQEVRVRLGVRVFVLVSVLLLACSCYDIVLRGFEWVRETLFRGNRRARQGEMDIRIHLRSLMGLWWVTARLERETTSYIIKFDLVTFLICLYSGVITSAAMNISEICSIKEGCKKSCRGYKGMWGKP